MKVGVTGADGHVGRLVVKELLQNGHEVRAITLGPWSDPPFPVECRQADVTKHEEVQAAVSGCDAVIHLAAIPSPRKNQDALVFQTNADGCFNVLLACGLAGIRRVAVASSDCAFGITFSHNAVIPDYLPLDERHPCRPDNCYGLSKQAAEQIADAMARRFGMSIASLRITWVVDPENYRSEPYLSGMDNPELGPWNLWSYIDGRDCARAFRLAIERDLGGHEVFCIAATEQRCTLPTRKLIQRYFPDAEMRHPFPGRESLLNCAKAAQRLGFTAKYIWGDE